MSRAYRGGLVGFLLLIAAFWAALVALFVLYGHRTSTTVAACLLGVAAALMLWMAGRFFRRNRAVLVGTVLTLQNGMGRMKSCDLAKTTSARVTESTAYVGTGTMDAVPVGSLRQLNLRLEGGGDLRLVSLRAGFRWPRPEDLSPLVDALRENPDCGAVRPALEALEQLTASKQKPSERCRR